MVTHTFQILRGLNRKRISARNYFYKGLDENIFAPAKDIQRARQIKRVWKEMKGELPAEQSGPRAKILFVTEKWVRCDPRAGVTNSEHNLFHSFASTGLGNADYLHFDEHLHVHGNGADESLLQRCVTQRPEMLFLSWSVCNPNFATLKIIRQYLKIPIVAIWWDSVDPIILRNMIGLEPYVDFSIVLDSPFAFKSATRHPEKYLPLPTPEDPSLFFNADGLRDIGLSFVGSIKHTGANPYPERVAGIKALQGAGVPIHTAGGRYDDDSSPLSPERYAELFRRSKIALNFSASHGKYPQAKGRIFESTLSGAMLLESDNPATAYWFTPMVDYVPFSDETDLVDKARYYLAHEPERAEIAFNGCRKATEQYSAAVFWETVFTKVLPPIQH